MPMFSITFAEKHLSELGKRVLRGEEVVITRWSKPVVRLIPLDRATPKILPGSGRGARAIRHEKLNAGSGPSVNYENAPFAANPRHFNLLH
jgi:prevent-host-death family protein